MTTRDLFTKGAQVWVPEPVEMWEGGEVQEDYDGKTLIVRTDSGQVHTLTIKSDEDLPPLRNPDVLTGDNNLTLLSYLHEPAVLHNLKDRFCNQNAIYTYCGIFLVAINPYQELPIYGPDTIWAYRGQAMGHLDPHIFAVAEEAYTKLERESRDQSIIVSGESGAGKTVSAKYIMRYFATVCGSATETQVERKVLASNPIMEAIGNAKTTINDNSSRFGKFIEIHFNSQHHIQGASMRTYLLEKSRVVFQSGGERNYHIFYQLCAARDLPQLTHLHLADQSKFHFTNQGQSGKIDNVDDAQQFEETTTALSLLGFTDVEQSHMFQIFAAVLHLGNIKITASDDGGNEVSAISSDDPHLSVACQLLDVKCAELRHSLCTRRIVSMREVVTKPMSLFEATSARDALAKHIYAQLFAWIVKKINNELESRTKFQRFIGILDIYGFETFKTNSFEQFCINYANEKLQQQFNQHVFKLEQEEYMKEEIEWKLIEFSDNQPCIDLIESKLGILDLLDEECRMPKGSDQSWAEKLYQHCKKSKHFMKPRFNDSSFIIRHFAGIVEYQSRGFLDRNRDTVVEEQIEVLRLSKNELVQRLFLEEGSEAVPATRVEVLPTKPQAKATSTKQHKKTVGSQFHDSLNTLMATLNATTPHYVRCIKPNDGKRSFEYNAKRAVQQLRACGVLETIRISAAGYSSRVTYAEFFQRYTILCKFKDIVRNNMKETCLTILKSVIKDENQYCFGKTQIFFRAGQVAYLEKLRAERLRACCIMMQKHIRGRIYRKRYLQMKKATLVLQRYTRGFLARRMAQQERETRAVICIQKFTRGWIQRRKYITIKRCVLVLQTHGRRMLARRRFDHIKKDAKATIIQKLVRGYLARRRFSKRLRYLVIAQSAVRRWLARRQLKKLKLEARSVEHVKKLNKGLENKIISLQQRIEELLKEKNAMNNIQKELNVAQGQLEELKALEAKTRKLPERILELEDELRIAKTQLRQEIDDKVDIANEAAKKEKKYKQQVEVLNTCIKDLTTSLDQLHDKLEVSEKGMKEELESQLAKERTLLITEQEKDRQAYQKLLEDFHALESKHESMERKNARLRAVDAPVPAPRSTLHKRSLSNASSWHAEEASSEGPEDGSDIGYRSVRSNTSFASTVTMERKSPSMLSPSMTTSSEQDQDIGLILKLQQKVKSLEQDRHHMQSRLDDFEKERSHGEEIRAQDVFKLQELEMENAKLMKDIDALRKAVNETGHPDAIGLEKSKQGETLQQELSPRRLRSHGTVLANKTKGLNSLASTNYAAGSEVEDNERQQKLRSHNLTKSSKNQTKANMQLEINRLTSENLLLQEKCDNLTVLTEQLKKRKIYYKALAKKYMSSDLRVDIPTKESTETIQESSATPEPANLPVVRKKDRDYVGMLEYRQEDEALIITRLVYELKPTLAITLLPGLPAYILFMCIRHTNYIGDDDKLRSLLTSSINGLRKVIKNRSKDLDMIVLWLCNTVRLLHTLKQYSGDKTFQAENNPTQNQQCLRNFDFSEYQQKLSDIAVWMYQGLIKLLETRIRSLIQPAILDHEMKGLFGIIPIGASVGHDPQSPDGVNTGRTDDLDALTEELNYIQRTLSLHGMDPELVNQVFRQLFYFICATAFNTLLLKKDLCNWTKSNHIQMNINYLAHWLLEHQFQDKKIVETLQPIIQACTLIHHRKTEGEIEAICEMCNKLSVSQIMKILKLYTPDDCEPRVPATLNRQVEERLRERAESTEQAATLLMDSKFSFPVTFPFNPSNIRLEDVEIPECLHLPFLKKI